MRLQGAGGPRAIRATRFLLGLLAGMVLWAAAARGEDLQVFCPGAVQGCNAADGTVTGPGTASSVIFDLRGYRAVSVYLKGAGGSAGTFGIDCSANGTDFGDCGSVFTIADGVTAVTVARTNFARVNVLSLTSGNASGYLTREH